MRGFIARIKSKIMGKNGLKENLLYTQLRIPDVRRVKYPASGLANKYGPV